MWGLAGNTPRDVAHLQNRVFDFSYLYVSTYYTRSNHEETHIVKILILIIYGNSYIVI